ncbi:MAG: HigA family addiction module antitoxin [Verrucomicrobiota bacterium]
MKTASVTIGEILLEDFMKPLGLTIYRLAKDVGVSSARISDIIKGKSALSIDTALRLGIYFGNGPGIWLRMQSECELRKAKKIELRLRKKIKPCQSLIA